MCNVGSVRPIPNDAANSIVISTSTTTTTLHTLFLLCQKTMTP